MDSPLARMLSIKRKKFSFDASLSLELTNIPIVTGVLFCKVRLFDGGFVDFSSREEVHDNRVVWPNHFRFTCKMFPNQATEMLDICPLRVSVRKETRGGKASVKLGYVDLNLAEYAGAKDCQRRYLLTSYNDNKRRPDNSILKVNLSLKVMTGGPVFRPPPIPQLTGILVEEMDEGIQADVHRPTSVLSNSSSDSSRQPSQRASTFSGSENPIAVLQRTSVSSSNSSLPNSEPLRRHSASYTGEEGCRRRESTLTTGSDSCGTLVDTAARQPIAEPAMPSGSHTPNPSPVSPQSRPTQHRRNVSIGSRCSSAYSTMSDTDRHYYLEVHHRMLSESTGRLRSGNSAWERVNPEQVVEKLMEGQDFFDQQEGSEEDQRLRLYVDRSGVATVAGHDLQSTEEGRRVVEVINDR